MPLPGGAAEKFGNRYERRWTVACLLDVMDEKADSIRLEPPEPEGQGFEFWIRETRCPGIPPSKATTFQRAVDTPHSGRTKEF